MHELSVTNWYPGDHSLSRSYLVKSCVFEIRFKKSSLFSCFEIEHQKKLKILNFENSSASFPGVTRLVIV